MTDRDLSKRIRDLPRETARPGFTQRVMERLDEEAPRAAEGWGWKPTLAIAAAALGFALIPFAAWQMDRGAASAGDAAELEALRAEYTQLQDALQELTRVRGAGGEVVYLGGDDTLDVVFDPAPMGSQMQPASYTVPAGGTRR